VTSDANYSSNWTSAWKEQFVELAANTVTLAFPTDNLDNLRLDKVVDV